MLKSAVCTITLLIFLQTIAAQHLEEISKNQIAIDFGYQANLLKDDNFSPLHQAGGGLATSLNYTRIAENIYGATVEFSPGSFHSGPSNEFKTSYINANLAFEYLFKLSRAADSYQLFLGPAYNTRVLYLDWNDLDAFSYVATHGIGVKGHISRTIHNEHVIQATLSIPIFQFLSRPPYNGIDEFIIENQDKPANIILNGSASSFNKYAAMEFCVDYTYHLTQHIDCDLNYTLFTQKVQEPNMLKSLSNTISTGIAFHF